MQGYSYSVFSIVAMVIHVIINFDLLTGRRSFTARGTRYRGFLAGVLAYYVTDAAWGIIAGLGWTRLLYVDTIFFFLALVAFVYMWSVFVIDYLQLGKWPARILTWFGYGLWAFNFAAVAANPFNKCFFHIDSQGTYQTGWLRNPAFYLLVAYNLVLAVFVLAKASASRDSVRRRSMMIFQCCLTMAVAIFLQIVWPLTPFTALGCLISNCFLHVFVVQDEQAAMHMAELEKALELAHAAEKARSMFFSIVSHDIRTPLNAILGYSELLQHGIRTEAEKDEALNAIRASGATLLELVNDVLDLAKMDSGKMTFHPVPVRLERLTGDVFASFGLSASEKGIELVNRTGGLPVLLLDEQRFRQILFNLVGNAVKFTARGSVTVAASYAGTTLELSVSDTGRGIPPDMLTHILEPFVQVRDPSHSGDRAAGTGLGLPICKSMIEAMGGEFIVESELGKGSTFRARIPGVAVSAGESKDAAMPKLADLDAAKLPKHVLVVDDSPVNRKVLAAFLRKAGIASVGHAGDGAEAYAELALALNTGRPYDFILSDLWMPNINGLELIEKIRADQRFRHLPVFALTADTEFQRDARAELFTGVLLKPLTYDKLLEVFAAENRGRI